MINHLQRPSGGPSTSENAEREYREKRRPKGSEAVWVDWSGYSAVWVCSCGQQGMGGFTLNDGRWSAMKHRSEAHPNWSGAAPVWVEQPPCQWGKTVWADLRNHETCDRDPVTGGFCKTHYQQNHNYETHGMCSLEGCPIVNSPGQALCRTDLTRWANANGISPQLAREGKYIYPDTKSVIRVGAPRIKGAPIDLPYNTAHGTRKGYRFGCRCSGPEGCAEAQSQYARQARINRLANGGKS